MYRKKKTPPTACNVNPISRRSMGCGGETNTLFCKKKKNSKNTYSLKSGGFFKTILERNYTEAFWETSRYDETVKIRLPRDFLRIYTKPLTEKELLFSNVIRNSLRFALTVRIRSGRIRREVLTKKKKKRQFPWNVYTRGGANLFPYCAKYK